MISTEAGTTWIGSEGGPLILMPASIMLDWEGTNTPSRGRIVEAISRWDPSGETATDYDRACDIERDLGLISVGDKWGLVLNTSPDDTTWHSWTESDGCLIRLTYLDDGVSLTAHLESIRNLESSEDNIVLSIPSETLYLFDSAFSGDFVLREQQFIQITLREGQCAIFSDIYEPDDSVSLRIHQLRKTE